ncbi:uncharacterized protein LOC105174925 [Sesamum indicum]|uniref:Uncharacterized protein LOC105174925 n=1 Tax=Sesamum indicum TaxID=4182 RepID=A0A6I9U4J3_SESIN|nr:uncharacterized protein LOC105174925 [Sesamum indicum]
MAFFTTRLAALLISLSVVLSAASATDLSSYLEGFKDHFRFLHSIVPKEEQAKDCQYLTEQMTAAVKQVEQFSATAVAKRLKDPPTDDCAKKALLLCEEAYKKAVEMLKKGVESVSAGDFVQAKKNSRTFINYINACDDSFGEFRNFGDWARGVGDDCLGKIVKYV